MQIRQFILILSLLGSLATGAQTWCLPGAEWYYTAAGTVYGFVRLKYEQDTIINSITAKKISKYNEGVDYWFGNTTPHFYYDDPEFMYEQNGVVYIWYNNNWDTLYNINASIGDSWRLAKQPYTTVFCNSNSTLTVIDTGTMIVSGIPLRYLDVVLNYGPNWEFSFIPSYKIIEIIGSVGPLNFYEECNQQHDGYETEILRCYSDSIFSYKDSLFNDSCTHYIIPNVQEYTQNKLLQIYPNPASNNITINLPKKTSVLSIYNYAGQLVEQKTLGNNEQIIQLNVADFPSGIYLLQVQGKDAIHFKKIVKQ